ncbi:MAG TPA: DUF445 domain-containing protein [Roseiflexaceae bacterium]|nr:DUF445 domain-containing protein [Roseiflexaceae bacterium]HMP40770.1 DUF445 domain-containing protein [Roseiflexaceae bacterium]
MLKRNDNDDVRRAELDRMKHIATGLLVLAAGIFVVALRFESQYPWARFVRAAAEGAMVGAIADWFAVTALFRHPLGLPIPHTAIIPRRKNDLGASIGRFMRDNFLTTEVISSRLRSINAAARLGSWLARDEPAERVARILASGAAGTLRVVNDDVVQSLIERTAVNTLQATPATPLIGRALGALFIGRRRHDLLYALVQLAAQLLEEHQDSIRRRIVEGSPWWMPRGVDRTIYTRLVETVTRTLTELRDHPEHPLHARFDEIVERFVEQLQHDPDLLQRGEAYKQELLGDPIVRDLAASLWQDAKHALLEQSEQDNSALRDALTRGLMQIGELLQRDEQLAARINDWIESVAHFAAREYGDEVRDLIEHTVQRWDAASTAHRIELQVGRDLQFIRINGTIVGGLAGLVISLLSLIVE